MPRLPCARPATAPTHQHAGQTPAEASATPFRRVCPGAGPRESESRMTRIGGLRSAPARAFTPQLPSRAFHAHSWPRPIVPLVRIPHRFPAWIPWIPHRFPWIPHRFPWIPHRFPALIPWIPHRFPWIPHRFPALIPWIPHRFPWILHRFPWIPHRFPAWIPWIPHRFPSTLGVKRGGRATVRYDGGAPVCHTARIGACTAPSNLSSSSGYV